MKKPRNLDCFDISGYPARLSTSCIPAYKGTYNPGHFTSVLLFFGITFDPGMLKILKTRHLKAKISYFLIVKFWVPSWYPIT